MLIYEKPEKYIRTITHKIKKSYQHIIKNKFGIIIIYNNEKTTKKYLLVRFFTL